MKQKENKGFPKTSSQTSNSFNKIELVNCPRNGMVCGEQLSEINRMFLESNDYQHNKEYQLSIKILKDAYDKTWEMSESTCYKCATLFRAIIRQSLENMHIDLQRMSKGTFKGKRYMGSLHFSEDALNNLREEG